MKSTLEKLFFALVFASEANVWVRAAGGNTGLKAGAQASAFSSGNGDPILFSLNMLVLATTVVVCYPKLRQISAMLLDRRWLLAIYLYSAVSILWSANRGNTFRMSVYLIAGVIQFVYIALYFEAEEQIRLIGDLTSIFALLSVAGQYLMAPVQDLAPGWAGIFPSKNYLGNVMALGIIALVLRSGRWTLLRSSQVLLCAVLLLLSRSFTSVLCILAAMSIIVSLRLPRNMRMFLMVSAVGLGLLALVMLPNIIALLLGASGKDTTLTGRDVIWAFALRHIAIHPILGYGYSSFWISEGDSAMQYLGWNPGQAHNGFLNLALEEGWVGVGLLLALLFSGLRTALRQLRLGDPTGAGLWLLVMFVYLIVHNVSEADFYQRPAWLIYVIAYVAASRAELPWVYPESERSSHTLAFTGTADPDPASLPA